MFWGAIKYNLKSNLVPLNGDPDAPKGGFTARLYVELLEEYLPTLLDFDSIFMQDNAPIHTARLVTDYLLIEGVEVLVWPPYSPDMNPIENLWHWLKDQMHKRYPELATLPERLQSIDRLVEIAEELWESIPEEMINNLIDSMPRKVEALFQAQGWYTKY
jgi:transposase